jgi:hypothetical protein
MATTTQGAHGSVASLRRCPVKSMGEELNVADATECGLLADRASAVVNRSDGKIAHVGAYASVLRGGTIRRGNSVRVE